MKTKGFLAVALALAVVAVSAAFSLPGLDMLGETVRHVVAGNDVLGGLLGQAAGLELHMAGPVALAAMRTELTDLTRQADELVNQITEDLGDEAIREIEDKHRSLQTKIRGLKLKIEQREAEDDPADDNTDRQPNNGTEVERERAAAIHDLAVRAGQPELAQAAITEGVSVDAFRAQLFDQMLENQPAVSGTARAQVGEEAGEKTRSAMTEALAYGMGAPMPEAGPSDGARQFMGRGLIDLAAERINYRAGRILNARSIDDILVRASHATSDFPAIFENALNRSLEGQYALAQPTFKAFARRRDFRDFRPHTSVKIGDFPMLKPILENGEIKAGTFTDGKETISVMSYGRQLRISRHMLINDDLGAIAELLASYGSTVALFEELTFYADAFNGKLADGKTVFHTDHANLTAAGTAIDVDNVGKARAAMGKQKSIDGNALLGNTPKFILTGPDMSTEAEKLVASVTPASASAVNPFSGKLTPIETAQITDKSWTLLGDPARGSNWRWGYLDGYEAPRVRMDEPFGTQGFAMSVEHDFGAGAVDHRFAHKNPGQ
jgi:phage major head subunit gpT-like protein